MRLNDDYLRSIAYIGCARPDDANQIDTHGTGFLLVHEEHTYLVTAAHVAVDFDDGPMAIRLNNFEGLGSVQHFDEVHWFFHADSTIDVAVLPISVPPWAAAASLKSSWIATEFKLTTKDFGAGDLAYIVGIFNKMRGQNKNVPFVHTGHIASMGHGEVALMKDWRLGAQADASVEVAGYFVQATTLPESSGSPVFVRRSIELGDTTNVRKWVYGSVWLLGLWSGNWSTNGDRGVIVGDDMGICVPAPKILDVLDRDELRQLREHPQIGNTRAVGRK